MKSMAVTYPPPLMTSESFARHTVAQRLPSIVADVIAENAYPAGIVAALRALQDEIAGQPVAPLTEDAPDTAAWRRAWEPYQSRTWLQIPWYWAESYFYRRLLAATRYFQPGRWQGHDPFERRKRLALQAGETWQALSRGALHTGAQDERERFVALLHASLWGNRADLSNIALAARPEDGLSGGPGDNLLIDHTPEVWARLARRDLRRIDVVGDNAGLEALFDLALSDFLLGGAGPRESGGTGPRESGGWCRQIVFHLKAQPFFVSDTMIKDVAPMLAALQQAGGAAAALAGRLQAARSEGRWTLCDDPFWTGWLGWRDMPARLQTELAKSDLVILKGDLNYRRLVDDRRWPPTTRLEEVAAYFPASFLTLRTLKAEVVLGLRPGQAEALAAADPDWQINGRRGLIHLVQRPA